MKAINKWKNQSLSNKVFDICNYVLMILILLICAYPLYNVVLVSFSSKVSGVYFWPRDFTLEPYCQVLKQHDVWMGYGNTIIYTVGSVLCSLAVIIPCAYALSRKDFIGRGIIIAFVMVPMFISGGIVPQYLNMHNLGLLNSRWGVILSGLVSTYNIIITRSFFRTTIPDELLEATQIDGCGNGRFFTTMVLPLSKPILAVLALYVGVAKWNSYFSEMVYLRDYNKYPVTLVLRRYLSNIQEIENLISEGLVDNISNAYSNMQTAAVMQYCLIVITTIPMLIIYPFIQKYFAKGVMIGSVKG